MGDRFRSLLAHPRMLPVLIRVLADAAMLLLALTMGVAVDALWRQLSGRSFQPFAPAQYLLSVAMMIAVGLAVFALSGFYTRGRAYMSRYKVLIVGEAVMIAFLVFGAMAYALKAHVVFPPAVALAIGGAMCTFLLTTSRVWSALWSRLTAYETGRASAPDRLGRDRVLVIGGAGYIGSALLPELLAHGHKVRVLDLCMFGEAAIAEVLDDPDVEFVRADFRQVDDVVRAMRGVHSVIHLGGLVGDPASAVDAELTLEVNLLATQLIAQAAKAHGVRRFVFASTCSVYGASDEILDERSRLNPVSLYAKSKIASERVLQELSDDQFRPTILRFGTVYGQSGRTRFDLVVNLLCAKAVVDGRITVHGEDQWRPFVHVSDVAHAVRLALDGPDQVVAGHVFNVGSTEQNLTLGELGRRIQSRVPGTELVASPCEGDRRNYRVCFAKIRNQLGFVPAWTIERGIDQVVSAVAAGQVADYSDGRYSNVKVLEELIDRHEVGTMRQSYLAWLESTLGFEDQVADVGEVGRIPPRGVGRAMGQRRGRSPSRT